MNEQEKREFLNMYKPENERYITYVFGTIITEINEEYYYIGLTKNYLIFVNIDSIDTSKIKNTIKIHLNEISDVKVNTVKLFGKTTINFKYDDKKIKLILMNNIVETDMYNQKEGIDEIVMALTRKVNL